MLLELKKAPLKPYQRLDILKTFLVPKLTHKLVLGNAHSNTIKRLNVVVCSAVRNWLHLPKDTPFGFLHASIKDGGIGIPCFRTSVPLLQKARYSKILTSSNEIFEWTRRQKGFVKIKHLLDLPC